MPRIPTALGNCVSTSADELETWTCGAMGGGGLGGGGTSFDEPAELSIVTVAGICGAVSWLHVLSSDSL